MTSRDHADAIEAAVEKAATSTETADEPNKHQRRNLLSTGSTLLNLACSDNPFGGLLKGKYYFFVGDSISGKTFLCMTCFAEATINRHFREYRFIYDNIEDGCLLDLEKLFNKAVAERIEAPQTENGNPEYSATIEDFYDNIDDAIKEGRPFIYVLDSMDALSSEAEGEKFEEQKKARRAGKEAAGSYGDGKAKKNSQGIRRLLNDLRSMGSILIVISQTRDNIGGYGKTRSGGRALKFYATIEVWSNVEEPLKKTVGGKEREIGVRVALEVKKNRITGKRHTVEVDIYPSYGIDDIGSLVDYLLEEGWWTQEKQTIQAKGLGLKGTREKLIRLIEEKSLMHELRALAGRCWREVDEACSLKRKGRYVDNDK